MQKPATSVDQDETAFPLQLDKKHLVAARVKLQSATGERSLSDYHGKVVVMFFGFTHCPDVCPRDLSIVAKAFEGLNDKQLKQTQGVFISLDPDRDDPKTLQEFTQYFHSNLIGLTGEVKQLDKITSRYGIHYKKVQNKKSKQDYFIEHTASLYVLDKEGRLSYILPNGISSTALRQSIEYLLDGKLQD